MTNKLPYTFLAALLLILSCSNPKEKNTNQNTTSNTDNINHELDDANKNAQLDELVSLFTKNKEAVELKLKSASEEQANKLYEKYFEENQTLLIKIIELESRVLEHYYEEDKESIKNVQTLGEVLKKHDLIYDDLGEGIVEITTTPNFYYSIFKTYVSKDYKDYLFQKSEENKTTYASDASLVISFKDLGDRIIIWENFIHKYPESKLLPRVKEDYKNYQLDYLFGMDNTQTREITNPDSIYINQENIEEFNRFKKQYTTSETTRLIKIFIDNFKSSNIHDIIKEEQMKF